jgi:hypothetical protein
MGRRRSVESAREEVERLDQLHQAGDLDQLPYARLRRYAKEPSQVYAIRIPASRLHQIRLLAGARDEQPTSLLREWVLERLDAELAVAVGEKSVRYDLPAAVDESIDRTSSPGSRRRRSVSTRKSKAASSSRARPPRVSGCG